MTTTKKKTKTKNMTVQKKNPEKVSAKPSRDKKPHPRAQQAQEKKPHPAFLNWMNSPDALEKVNNKKASVEKKSTREKKFTYPFAAVVGQEEMKLALILNVIDPNIGGVMIMGHRGTGKSTVVRALADMLPTIHAIENCPYNSSPDNPYPLSPPVLAGKIHDVQISVPVVDLPLGATEDRVCGTLDIEKALSEGKKSFEPGLLAKANRGFLYIDEVNLLEDHLVDVLLDVAQSGKNIVEREGISISHPARFVLVGSGNPEEGDLRPQLLDRFGLNANILTIYDLDQRVEIVKLRTAYEQDPKDFCEKFDEENAKLRKKIKHAQGLLPKVEVSDVLLRKIAELCVELGIDGHRGELTITRTAKALAAFENKHSATLDEVRRVAILSLRHRLRKDPLETADSGDKINAACDKVLK
jgi:magnesium chelatase subunit I